VPLFNPEQLLRPTSINEAVEILSKANGSARLVAGDTTLYDLAQHSGLDDVRTLVDVSKLGLSYIKQNDRDLEIGASTTFAELENSKLNVGKGTDALFETAAKITPPQVRNMATIGGALCSGIPFLDMPTTVLALDAEITTASVRGERKIKSSEFFVDYFQTAVEPDEIVTSIKFPLEDRSGSAFLKLGRVTIDFAILNVAVWIARDSDDSCRKSRIALGAIANVPIRWKTLEEELLGKSLSEPSLVQLVERAKMDFEPSPSLGAPANYKKLVIPKMTKNAILECIKRS
jgi:carbon-monoxide dehydrogenase medium subunit